MIIEQKNEAIRRLEILKSKGLMGCVLREFKKDGTIYMSEFNGMCGALYYMNDLGGAKQEWIDAVKQFEKRFNCLVYHVTHEMTWFGEVMDMFYVSNYPEEWRWDRDGLESGYPTVYAYNLSDPALSDIGSIAIKIVGGGVVRTDYMNS